jgi:hypothetical protein
LKQWVADAPWWGAAGRTGQPCTVRRTSAKSKSLMRRSQQQRLLRRFRHCPTPVSNARHRTRTPMPPGRSSWAPVQQQGRPEQGDPLNSSKTRRAPAPPPFPVRIAHVLRPNHAIDLLVRHGDASSCLHGPARHRYHTDLARCLATAHPALTPSAGEGGQRDAGSARSIARPSPCTLSVRPKLRPPCYRRDIFERRSSTRARRTRGSCPWTREHGLPSLTNR